MKRLLIFSIMLNLVLVGIGMWAIIAPFSLFSPASLVSAAMEGKLDDVSNADIEFFRNITIFAVSDCNLYQQKCYYWEIEEFLNDKIKYIGDPAYGQETTTAREIYRRGYGDCEDRAKVFVAMARSINLNAEIVVKPDLSHAYVETPVGEYLNR